MPRLRAGSSLPVRSRKEFPRPGALLPDVNPLGGCTSVVQKAIVREVIVQNDVGAFERPAPLEREEPGIAGSRAHQINFHPFKISRAPALRRRSPSARPRVT